MAVPTIQSVEPSTGLTTGGDLVRLIGLNLSAKVAVRFGERAAYVLAVHTEAGMNAVDVRTPPNAAGGTDVVVTNLDASGAVIAGEEVRLPSGFLYARPDLHAETDTTRLVRAVLRLLKEQVLEQVHLSVHVDYAEPSADGVQVTALASLPSLVLSGPQLRDNAFATERTVTTEIVPGITAPDIVLRRPSQAFDLVFQLTGASDRAIELINLTAAVTRFLDRNRWLDLARDPNRAELGSIRFELDRDGDTRTRVAGQDGVHVFTSGFVVRGVPLVEGPPLDRTRPFISLSL